MGTRATIEQMLKSVGGSGSDKMGVGQFIEQTERKREHLETIWARRGFLEGIKSSRMRKDLSVLYQNQATAGREIMAAQNPMGGLFGEDTNVGNLTAFDKFAQIN